MSAFLFRCTNDGVAFGPARIGDPVIASADGVVERIEQEADTEIEIFIRHNAFHLDHTSMGAAYITGYTRLRSAAVRVGQRVVRGEKIGEVGIFWEPAFMQPIR